jgi:hypothetical protein
VGESSYNGEQHTFGFNYLINNFPETHYFISQRATINLGSQHRNKPRSIHLIRMMKQTMSVYPEMENSELTVNILKTVTTSKQRLSSMA